MPSRDDAWQLLTEYVASESLRKHCLAVEAAMRAYAKKYGEDPAVSQINGGAEEIEKWAIIGLLHDFDYEKWPEEHPMKGSKILEERGYPEDIRRAILGHATYSLVRRDTLMAKTLFAVDELCGMVMATAHVRPQNFEGMSTKSVKKNLKKKGFAAAINRNEIEQGIKELGADRDEHIALVIEAMRSVAPELGF